MNTLCYVGLVSGPLNFERQGLLYRKFIGRLVWDLGFSWRFTVGVLLGPLCVSIRVSTF